MTYRIAVAGMLWAALVLGGGCASTPSEGAEAPTAPDAVAAEGSEPAAPKVQPKVLERSAPSAKEIETPLQGGTTDALPVIAQGSTPVGEGGTPRSNPPAVPPARPGESPVVAEVIDIPTTDLHGGAFPGVGTAPKANGNGNGNGKPANAEVNQRIAAIEQQLGELRTAAVKTPAPATGPDLAAFAAVQARLDDLATKVDRVAGDQATLASRPAAAPASSGVAPERVEAIEKELEGLRAIAATREDITATEKERAVAGQAYTERLAALEAQLDGLASALEKATASNAAPTAGGLATAELAQRLDAMQQQLDAAQQGWASAAKAAPSDPALQARIEELSEIVARIQQDQAARPTPAAAEVPDARFAQIEQQIASIQQAVNAPKSEKKPVVGLDDRFSALETQLDALRGELAAQSKELALAKAAKGVDGSVRAALTPDRGEYRIGAGDKMEFQSFNDEKISREEVTVRFDGYVSLPLIPDVAVGNLTRGEAEERIREEYRSIFRDPQIALIVRDAVSKNFTIVGDIEKPGVFPFTQSTTLIEAISLAGGLRRRSSSSSVGGFVGVTGQLTKAFIVRNNDAGERDVLQFDLRGLGKPGAHDSQVPIQYGDLIYVPEGVNLVYLLGESRNPVIVELTEGMKLLQLLSLAGGFDASTARLNGVVLMRQTDDDNTRVIKVNVKEILRGGKDIALIPGDIVYIPRKRLLALQEFVQRFTGTISPVLDLYTSAVDAYFAIDLQRSLANDEGGNRTLEVLQDLEGFGSSTANIVDLFRRP